MKKTLLAAALFAGFAGVAQADSSVTLYGIIDTGIAYGNYKTASGKTINSAGMDSGAQSGSRWGMKGVEDLGDGLSTVFTLEGGSNDANGTLSQGGRIFGRRAYVGFTNPAWGTLLLGRGPTATTDLIENTNVDPFNWGWGAFNLGAIATSVDTYRTDNHIAYTSPNFGGFTLAGSYSFNVDNTVAGTGTDTVPLNDRAQGLDIGGSYVNGPVTVVVTYGQTNPYAASGAPSGAVRQAVVAGTYDLTVVQLHAAYVHGWNGLTGSGGGSNIYFGSVTGLSTGASATNAYEAGAKQNAYELGLTVPIGAATSLFGAWMHQTIGGFAGSNAAQNTFAVGATYNLSKRTDLYATAGYINGLNNVSGQKGTLAAVGIRHQF